MGVKVKSENQPSETGFRLIGLDPGVESVYVPITGRTYILADITPEQAEQLLALKWAHIERVTAVA